MDKYAELEVFLCVVQEGNFSAAARKLLRSPSAISKIMARLEARLAVRLFDRIGGTIRLTHEGQIFLGHAQAVTEAMASAEHAVNPEASHVSGLLRVHTSLTVAKYQLAPMLPALLAQHPALHIEFVIGTERGNFIKKDIDVAIHSGNPTELSLVGKQLYIRRWIVAASPDYVAAHGVPLVPQDLLSHRCLNFTVRHHWNIWTFSKNGVAETINIDGSLGADQGELLRTLALEGLGIVRLAEFHIGADIAAGRLLRLLPDYEAVTDDVMYVLYPHGRALAPRVRAFISFLEEQFKH
ncbi:LysR family transcriptional regulator [Alcaligenaceae bacterium]|nr:LysR family transcriptional regulator [Alcaligenaceae bacterium]